MGGRGGGGGGGGWPAGVVGVVAGVAAAEVTVEPGGRGGGGGGVGVVNPGVGTKSVVEREQGVGDGQRHGNTNSQHFYLIFLEKQKLVDLN